MILAKAINDLGDTSGNSRGTASLRRVPYEEALMRQNDSVGFLVYIRESRRSSNGVIDLITVHNNYKFYVYEE